MIKKKTIKDWLKQSGWFTIKAPNDPIVDQFKTKFDFRERSFYWNWRKYLVKTLYCHASPGVIETIIKELSLRQTPAKNRLLNLGGGTGQVSEIFRQLGYQVHNVDIELEKVDENNTKWNLNHFPYPFKDQIFDVIVGQEIIEHIENPWEFFRQARRLLKSDGLFIVSTPNILSRLSRWQFFLTGYFPWFTPNCFEYHINPMPFWQIELVAKQTGFSIEKILGNGNYLFPQTSKKLKNILNKNEEIILILKTKS